MTVKTIGDTCEKPQYGFTTSATNTGGVKLLRTTDITSGFIDWETVPFCRDTPKEVDKFRLKDGDIVVSRAGSVGASILVQDPVESVFASYLIRLRPKEGLRGSYLSYFLQSPQYWRQIADHSAGIAIPNVNATKLCAIRIPVPDEMSQETVVEEIEKQFSRLDAGVEALKRAQANLKRYRASILKAACGGRLLQLHRDSTANSDVALVPTDWQIRQLRDLGSCITGSTPSKSHPEYWGESVPFFKPTDLDQGYKVERGREFLSESGSKHARMLPARAVLVTCIGATIGKTGFSRCECATNQQINAFVANESLVLPEYVFWVLTSPLGRLLITSNASATTLPILNKSRFEKLSIPIPHLRDQRLIVDEIERLMSLIEGLGGALALQQIRASSLKRATLSRAFGGADD